MGVFYPSFFFSHFFWSIVGARWRRRTRAGHSSRPSRLYIETPGVHEIREYIEKKRKKNHVAKKLRKKQRRSTMWRVVDAHTHTHTHLHENISVSTKRNNKNGGLLGKRKLAPSFFIIFFCSLIFLAPRVLLDPPRGRNAHAEGERKGGAQAAHIRRSISV